MKKYSKLLSEENFVIFLSHGIINTQNYQVRNYTRKHILKKEFEFFLEDLTREGTPVSMEDILRTNSEEGVLPRKSFAITFDDGFENNYSIAAPVLRKFGVPATFYITTGFVGSKNHSWIDLIEYAFEITPSFSITLPFKSKSFYESSNEKIMLLDEIRAFVKNNLKTDPYVFANNVWYQLGVSEIKLSKELDKKLDWSQVKELQEDPLFNIGGHSHTHRILSYLDKKELKTEICKSTNLLKKKLGKKITHYSYPEGLKSHYSDQVIKVLKDYGIKCSPTAIHGLNKIGDDLFHLKRIMVV